MELENNQHYFETANANEASSSKTTTAGDVPVPDGAQKRPKLMHAKSDSTVHQRNPFRRESPPLPLGNVGKIELPSTLFSPLTHSQSRSRDSSVSDSTNPQKRHISFNTFVEQCIAIEKPKKTKDGFYGVDDEDDEDEDDEDGEDAGVDEDEDGYREDDEGSENEEDDESEDDVLEMRSSSRSRGCSSRRAPSLSTASSSAASGWHPFDPSSLGSEREHVTIAPIAPTMLKTSVSPSFAGSCHQGSYGNLWEDEEQEDEGAFFVTGRQYASGANPSTERMDSVNLVYVPPHGSVYAERISGAGGTASGSTSGVGGTKAFEYPLSSPHPTTELRAASFDEVDLLTGRRRDDVASHRPFPSGFDLFGSPDMGTAVYGSHRSGLKRGGRSPGQSRNVSASDRSVSDATSGNTDEALSIGDSKGSSGSVSEEGTVVPPSLPPPSLPRPEALKAQREAQSSSPVRAAPHHAVPPSPSAAIAVPRQNAHMHTHITQSLSPAPSSTSTSTSSTGGSGSGASYGSPFLEPPMRGRSTSPITSVSLSGDSTRGRSGLRGSSMSLSDVERSGRDKEEREPPRGRSRSRSTGAVSPLGGSVSPRTGSHCRLGPSVRRASIDGGGGIGFGGYGTTYMLSASPTWTDKSLSPEESERGRSGRTKMGANGGESVSPPKIVREKDAVVIDDGDAPAPRPEAAEGGIVQHVEDVTRSLNPISSDSPTSSPLMPLVPLPPPTNVAVSATSTVTTVLPSHARSPLDETATLVGRASEIVSSAKGYLGSFWGSGERQLHHSRDGTGVSNILGSR